MTSARERLEGIAVLIPAYRPGPALPALVEELRQAGFTRIVVVDDGSGPGFQEIFGSVAEAGVTVLGHPANLGKGSALKTGIAHALSAFPGIAGIVTADADGQHLPADILRVAESLLAHDAAALIMGSRAFDGVVPLRSRLGNGLTRRALQTIVGSRLTDTQTGLRAIPAAFAASLLRLASTGYEFELDMLISARQSSVPIIEEPIQTVYEPGNKSSHFNPLADSMKIYFVLLRFTAVSLATALLDNTIFYLAYRRTGILTAQIAARAIAASFNYMVVRSAVFKIGDRPSNSLPKYIQLVGIGGVISYSCIRWLTGSLHLPVLRTKIAVESVLFFANFMVQRDWVFLRSKDEAPAGLKPRREPADAQPFTRRTALWWLLLAIPAVAGVLGFRSAHLLRQIIWTDLGAHRFHDYLAVFAAICVAFRVYARRYFQPALLAGVVLCSIHAVGFAPVCAVLLFVFSSTVLGRLAFGSPIEGPLAFLAGTALWIAAMYLTLHLPVHYPITHLIALTLPIATGYRESRKLAVAWAGLFKPAELLPWREYLAVCGIAFILIANWLVVLEPDVSTDGLAMHLAIPSAIALRHAFTIDFRQFIWALMPMGADLAYSVVYTLGGEYAARLLNFAMLTGLSLLLFRAAKSFVAWPLAALLTIVFVSTPLVYLITGSLFVENFVAFMVLGAVVALWRFQETHATRYLMLTALLLGSSMALKLGAVPAALIGMVVMALQSRRGGKQSPLAAAAAVAILLTVGAFPYASAWWQSGNPFFPFQTGPFKSGFVGNDIRDTRYNHPLSWRTPLALTFHTDRYYEGQPGSFGFQYLLFLPLAAGAFVAVRSFKSRSAIGIGIASAVIIAATQSNARYFYFILPLLTLGGAAALAWLRERERMVFQAAVSAAMAAGFWNVWFLPSADWYHRDFYSSPLFSAAGRAEYLHKLAPEREVVAWMNRAHPGETVLLADDSNIAGIAAPVHANNWHNYAFVKEVQASSTPAEVLHVFARAGIRQLIVDTDNARRQESVTSLIRECGQPEFSAGSVTAMTLRADCEKPLPPPPPKPPECTPGKPLPRGKFDQTDPRIRFLGDWTSSRTFPRTWKRSIAFSNSDGARACFTMEGAGLRYIYTEAFNRGIAELAVDGEVKAVVDLFSEKIRWQASTAVTGLNPGRHEVSIRVTERKNEQAKDFYIDLDAVEIY